MLDRDGYKIEKVIFESQPNFFVTANLICPRRAVRLIRYPFPAGTRGWRQGTGWQRLLITSQRMDSWF
jgi:hypothetical protein